MIKENLPTVGAIVGRFQIPELHEEHKALIQRVINLHSTAQKTNVLIILGLASDACKCTFTNPLDYSIRKAMIEKAFPTAKILYIKDVGNNEMWSKELDRIITSQIEEGQKVILYGSRDSFISSYKGKFPTIELIPTRYISGTEIRKNVGLRSKDTIEFREGVIWAVENQWPSALPVVDVAIIDKNSWSVLLIRKTNKNAYQFAGGFATPESESYEEDAAREAFEETNLICQNYKYLGSARIRDWRYRNEKNQLKSCFFVCEYVSGTPKVNDKIENIVELRWVPLNDLKQEMIIEEHHVLYSMLCKNLCNIKL